MKIATILLVCQVGVTGAEPQCSDSVGNCAKPRSSLMQLKSLKQKQQLQTTFGAQLASFQKFTDEMVAKYGGAEAPLQNATDPMIQTAVSTVLDFIHEMHLSLLHYHDLDVTLAGDCGADNISATCEGDYLHEAVIDNITFFNTTANTNHDNFLNCMNNRAVECNNENKFCEQYDDYRQQSEVLQGGEVLGDGPSAEGQFRQYLPLCVSTSFDQEHIRANHETAKATLEAMESCLVKTEKWLNGEFPPGEYTSASVTTQPAGDDRHDGLWPHYDQCQREHDDCKDHDEFCEKNQTTFEETYCTYEMHWDSKCGAWDTCARAAKEKCKNNSCDLIETNVLGRKADNETGMRLECLLQVLFGTYHADNKTFDKRLPGDERMDALNSCTSATYDTSFWDISCAVGETIPVPDICTRTCPREPTTDEFQTAYYFNEGLEPANADLLGTPQHGKGKHIFASSRACELLEGHESYTCEVKSD